MVSPGSALPSLFGSGNESVLVALMTAGGGWLSDAPGRRSVFAELDLARPAARVMADAAGTTGVRKIMKKIKSAKKTLTLPDGGRGVNDVMDTSFSVKRILMTCFLKETRRPRTRAEPIATGYLQAGALEMRDDL